MFVAASIVVYACSKVPITNRKQMRLLPESQMVSLAATSYEDFMKSNTLSTDVRNTEMVKRVGNNIAASVKHFLDSTKKADLIKGYNWEFNLIKNDTIPNAWCMPGGKVVVYTGILRYTKTEAGLAVVMGHEIAHAVARHGNERMSQSLLVQMGGIALTVALAEKPEQTKNIFLQAYGAGSQIGMLLPYSRIHETEADKLGLIFMAMSGYNPEEAVSFWERMAASGGAKVPEILSTHPSDEARVKSLKEYMPEALKFYKKK